MNNPFDRSKVRPSPIEILVAGLIWNRQGRHRAIPIAEIIRLAGAGNYLLDDRKVKDIVHQLRRTHRVPIGSSRHDPPGYFIMLDASDLDAGLGAYRRQLIEGWQVLRAVAPESWIAELRGQLTIEDTTP